MLITPLVAAQRGLESVGEMVPRQKTVSGIAGRGLSTSSIESSKVELLPVLESFKKEKERKKKNWDCWRFF